MNSSAKCANVCYANSIFADILRVMFAWNDLFHFLVKFIGKACYSVLKRLLKTQPDRNTPF